MQFSTVFTILAAAMTASALPSSHLLARGDDGDSTTCSSQSTAVCCDGLAANCAVTVLAKNCDNSAYCCESNAVQVSIPSLQQAPAPISTR